MILISQEMGPFSIGLMILHSLLSSISRFMRPSTANSPSLLNSIAIFCRALLALIALLTTSKKKSYSRKFQRFSLEARWEAPPLRRQACFVVGVGEEALAGGVVALSLPV